MTQMKNVTVDQTRLPMYAPIGTASLTPEVWYLPTQDQAGYAKLKDDQAVIEDLSKTFDGRLWAVSAFNGLRNGTHNDQFCAAINREGSEWVQDVQSPAGPLYMVSKRQASGAASKGMAAVMRIREKARLGIPYDVPLYSTGGWVTMAGASESELLDLHRQITSEKVQIGRQTFGAIFSNIRSYTSHAMLRFIRRKIISSTIAVPIENLLDHIKLTDKDMLFLGLAAATWPNGVKYERACTADIGKCLHVEKDRVFPSRMQRTDYNALSAYQLSIMGRRKENSVTLDELKKYQAEFTIGINKVVSLSEDNSWGIEFKVPTIAEYIDSGYRWIDGIEKQFTKAMITDEAERNEYLYAQAKTSSMRMYSHFVHAVYEDGVPTVEDTETIEEVLAALSADDSIRQSFMKETAKYIDWATVNVAAIDDYECSACSKPQAEPSTKPLFNGIIPIDAEKSFFTLMAQKVKTVQGREDIS